MKTYFGLILVTTALLLVPFLDFASGKHRKKTNAHIKGTKLFCPTKFQRCMEKEDRPPYKPSVVYCEKQMYKKYYCTKNEIHAHAPHPLGRSISSPPIAKKTRKDSSSSESDSGESRIPVILLRRNDTSSKNRTNAFLMASLKQKSQY